MRDVTAAVHRRPVDWFARATVSGFIALGVSTVALAVAAGVVGAFGEAFRGSGFLADWMYNLTHNEIVAGRLDALFASLAVHLVVGMFWAIAYAVAFEPRLRQYPGWLSGAIFSLLPFFLSVVLFLPLTGGGLFGSNLDAGPLPLIGNLVLHLLYGVTLGMGYAADREPVVSEQEPAEQAIVMAHAESGAARGLLAGVAIGLVLGAALGSLLMSGSQQIERLLGSWPIAMGVAGALAGGSVGALIGSMSGLTTPEASVSDEPPSTGQPIAAALLPLGVIAFVAAGIVSIGSLLLTVAGPLHQEGHYYYGGPIVVGLIILALVTAGATLLSRDWSGSAHPSPRGTDGRAEPGTP